MLFLSTLTLNRLVLISLFPNRNGNTYYRLWYGTGYRNWPGALLTGTPTRGMIRSTSLILRPLCTRSLVDILLWFAQCLCWRYRPFVLQQRKQRQHRVDFFADFAWRLSKAKHIRRTKMDSRLSSMLGSPCLDLRLHALKKALHSSAEGIGSGAPLHDCLRSSRRASAKASC